MGWVCFDLTRSWSLAGSCMRNGWPTVRNEVGDWIERVMLAGRVLHGCICYANFNELYVLKLSLPTRSHCCIAYIASDLTTGFSNLTLDK